MIRRPWVAHLSPIIIIIIIIIVIVIVIIIIVLSLPDTWPLRGDV